MQDDRTENNEQATPGTSDVTPQETAQSTIPEGGGEVELLKQKVEELQKLADLNKDLFLRKAAEFENYKRRNEAEVGNFIKNANEGLIISLLPILNDFVRSLKAGAENKDYDAFYKGVELIHNKFAKVLEMHGLSSFDSVGKPFDVEFHDALLQMPKEDVAPHTVIEEVERGYKLHDRVLRHAKVVVSTAPSPATEESTNQEKVKA